MPRVLVVGDAHVDEHQSLSRFDVLGNKIRADAPDYVVIIGDFLSLNCLSEWDKNKRAKMENRRYHLEMDAGNEALDRAGLDGSQPTNVVYLGGNHEDREDRYFDQDPTFEGATNLVSSLKLKERKIKFVPYRQVYTLGGVSFIHIPLASNGKPIGNPNVCQKALKLFHNSVVFGHTHTLDHAAEHRHGSPHLNQALAVGCFFEHVDDYAKGSMTNYWRGLVDMDIYSPNRFDFKTCSMRQLYDLHGGKSKTKRIHRHADSRTS